jgi:GNAT superfamily N-acetyltransferase
MALIEIRAFDPHTAGPEIWRSFHECRRALSAELDPDDPILSDAETEIEMRRIDPLDDCLRWLAFSEGKVIGFASAFFRRPGTADAAEHAPFLFAGGRVRAEARRRGAGSLLLGEVHALMQNLDKSMLTLATQTESGHAFMAKIGAAAKLTTVSSRATLAELDWPLLRQWKERASSYGLRWERYAGRVPREALLALLPEYTALFADVPLGDLEIAPVKFEIEGYDEWYRTFDRVGGAHHLIVLRAPDGSIAGLTEATWDSRMPAVIYQQLTAVARSWRGRGLAKALKGALLQQVHENHAEARIVRTGNGETNATMRSINARAGFKPHRRFVEYQITREKLDQWREGQARIEKGL